MSKLRTRIRASNWLVTYWELCIKKRDCHYKISPIVYWGKGLIVACCDNSGFSGMVTLKSPGGVFALEIFPIRKQITVSMLFSTDINLVGDLFVIPHVLHVNRIN